MDNQLEQIQKELAEAKGHLAVMRSTLDFAVKGLSTILANQALTRWESDTRNARDRMEEVLSRTAAAAEAYERKIRDDEQRRLAVPSEIVRSILLQVQSHQISAGRAMELIEKAMLGGEIEFPEYDPNYDPLVAQFEGWLPTSENINALPEPLRKYIHDLETVCDPAGDQQSLALLREDREALAKLSEEKTKRVAELTFVLQHIQEYWNGGEESAVDAIQHVVGECERALSDEAVAQAEEYAEGIRAQMRKPLEARIAKLETVIRAGISAPPLSDAEIKRGQEIDEQRIRSDERRKVYKEEQAGWLEAMAGVEDETAFCWADVAEHFGELLFALDAPPAAKETPDGDS